MNAPFQISLMREKFILRDLGTDIGDTPPIIALSNRIVLNVSNKSERDTYIVRTQNMHTCVRLAAAIYKEFMERGSLEGRMIEFNWDGLWKDVIKGFERKWNPDVWACVYHRGKPVYGFGEHHPFLDIIEKCDHKEKGDYEDSVIFAERAFKQAGKVMKIEHDANIALISKITDEEAKCGLIIRGANRTTTFNYTVKQHFRYKEAVKVATILSVSAAFLEGIQLAFQVGMAEKKFDLHMFEEYSQDYMRWKKSSSRLGSLNTAISNFELKYDVKYRPERPSFAGIVEESMKFTAKIFKKETEENANEDASEEITLPEKTS